MQRYGESVLTFLLNEGVAFEKGIGGSKIWVGWAAKLSFIMPYDY